MNVGWRAYHLQWEKAVATLLCLTSVEYHLKLDVVITFLSTLSFFVPTKLYIFFGVHTPHLYDLG